jgi:hypothetical protein
MPSQPFAQLDGIENNYTPDAACRNPVPTTPRTIHERPRTDPEDFRSLLTRR